MNVATVKNKIVDLPDGRYEFRLARDRRTDRQNRYVWAVPVKILFDYTGQFDTMDDCYDWLKFMFNAKTEIINGHEIRRGMSIAATDTKRFEEIMTAIRVWAYHELDLTIPAPNEKLNY